jgi:ABC-2 type transport system permease protein
MALLDVPLAEERAAIVAIARRDLFRELRRPGALLTQAIQILFFVLVYGVGFDGMVGSVNGVPFGAFVVPGIIAIQVVTHGMGAGLTFAYDREFGVLREMIVAPVPRMCVPLGKVAATSVLAAAQSALMLACAPLLGLRPGAAEFLIAVAVFAGTAVVFSFIGLLLASLVRRVETLQAAVQFAMYPLLFLSGSVFPPEAAPGWLATAMSLNPMTYAVDLARRVLLGTGGPASAWLDVAVLVTVLVATLWALRLRIGR